MGRNSWKLCFVFTILITPLVFSSSIQMKIDEQGRKVYYNIPRFTSSTATGVYWSSRVSDYLPVIQEVCSRHGVDSELVKALIQVESNYNPIAVSRKGASGLMQLMPATAARYGVQKIFDPKENVEGGVRYLKDLLSLFHDLELALAAYNAGEGAVQKYGGIPRYAETQNYVKKVLALYQGNPSYVQVNTKPRWVTYYKYLDAKGVTHYTVAPVAGVEMTKVSFYY